MTERKYVPMDDVLAGVDRTVQLLNYMLGERRQLYGTVIYLMELLGQKRVVMPSLEGMQEYHQTFWVKFDVEDGEFVVSLVEKEQEPDITDTGEGDGE